MTGKDLGKTLTKDIAEQFLADPASVTLKGFSILEDDAAAVLASSRQDLPLDGLETISATAAKALIPHDGGISLENLQTLSLPAAHALSQHAGPLRNLNLGGLIDEPRVFAALRKHPSLVAKVIQDDVMPQILKTKDIDKEDEYEFGWADASSRELHDEEYYGDPMNDGLQLLDQAEGRPVWSIPLASVKDSWVCENADAYTVYFIGDREGVIERLKALPSRILTAEIAQKHVDEGIGDFSEYGDISVEAARILGANFDWASGESLDLSGLSIITPEAADALSQPRPEDREEDTQPMLLLEGLESLPEDVAQAIGQRYWSMGLGAPAISPRAAASLCGVYSLGLKALHDMPLEVAVSLGKGVFPGGLCIEAPQLSEKVVEALARIRGPLLISGLVTLSESVAKALASHEGVLEVTNLRALELNAAKELAKHQGELRLGGLKHISDGAARMLVTHKGDVLMGIDKFASSTQAVLRQHHSFASR